jgi:ariadne-1
VDWGLNYEMNGDDVEYQPSLPVLGRVISRDAGPKLTRGFSFTLIDNKEIEIKQKALIERVEETLAVSKNMARAMLLAMQWDVERLQQRYFDNPEKTIMDLFKLDWVEVDERLRQNKQGTFCCPVCCEETSNPIIMECAHGLCRDCFSQYL